MNHSRELLTSCRRREGERLGAYAAAIQLYGRHGYPDFPAAARDELALHAFPQGLSPPRLGQHVRLIVTPTLNVALDVAERAEREFSDQPSLQLSTEDDCQDQSGPAVTVVPSLWCPGGAGPLNRTAGVAAWARHG